MLDFALTPAAPKSHEAWTLPAELLNFSEAKWQFFEGSLKDLQAPPGFVWLAVPVPAFTAAPSACRSRALPLCPLGFPPPVPVGRADVLTDVAVASVGPSSFLAEPHAATVPPGIWGDPAVLFCTPSVGLCWLWDELGFAEPSRTDDAFDVDELCLIAMEARLSAESGYDLENTATFGGSLAFWDAEAGSRLSCVLRPGVTSSGGGGLSQKRGRQRSSSPCPLACPGESRCRGRSLGRRAAAVSCVAGTVQRAVSSSAPDFQVVSSPVSKGWKSVRWKKLQASQRRAALDAQFERALGGLDSFDVSVLGAVRECPAKTGMDRLPACRRVSDRASVAGGSARALCGVVVVEPARPKWRSRFSLLRRYQHTSDAFRKSVLRSICAAPVVDMDDVPTTTCLRGTRKALNVAFVEPLPGAVVAGKSSPSRVPRLYAVAAPRRVPD